MVISPSEYIKKCLKIDFDNSVENIIDTGASIIIFEKGTMPIELVLSSNFPISFKYIL